MKSKIILSLIILLIFNNATTSLNHNDNNYDNERIEWIKQQILNKIGMKEVPRILQKPNIDLINVYIENDKQNKRIKEKRNEINQNQIEDEQIVYLLPKNNLNFEMKSPIFDLSLINQNDDNEIESIKIFVQYDNQSINNQLINKFDLIIKSIKNLIVLKRQDIIDDINTINIIESNQIINQNDNVIYEYDVTKLLITSNDTAELIRIYNDNFIINKSFIRVQIINQSKRQKRNNNVNVICTENTMNCCRQSFYVNFTEIGWNNWIIHPSGYNANYCKGKCNVMNHFYRHHNHETVVSVVIGNKNINLCCASKEMSSMSLIYMDIDYNIYHKILPDMIVESCDCL